MLLNLTGFVYFFAYAVVTLPIYYAEIPFFEQFKISDQPWAWRSPKEEVRRKFWELSRRSVRYFFINYGLLVPALTAGKYYLLGDCMSFSTNDWPSYQTLFLHNMALTLVHEFAFYWSHRLAHHPKLYKYHKVHHEYTQNTILASQHEHPIDYVVTIATPALVAVSVVNPHSVTLFQWIAWILIANLDDHVRNVWLTVLCSLLYCIIAFAGRLCIPVVASAVVPFCQPNGPARVPPLEEPRLLCLKVEYIRQDLRQREAVS
jgi:sterol desaturase/sphingolipid hydroxylase (fatty acid hydroxylase superfamily)